MLLPTPTLLLAAALTAPTLILHVQSLQIKPSPPRHPPKSLSSRSSSGPTTTPRTTWNRGGRSSSWQHSSTKPLRAYTVADNRNINPWLSFLKFPTSFADLASQFGAEDSLFSFEGGGGVEAAAKRPYMPNLEMETAAIMATEARDVNLVMEKDELILEMDTLTKKFEGLQSSMGYKSQLHSETIKGYEYKIENLEDKNAFLEEGLNVLTVTLERQEQQLEKLQQEKENNASKEANDNEMLRQRLRHLEVELSDIAFESRKVVMPAPPVEKPIIAHAKNSSVEAVASVNNAKVSPKAPSAPVPPHIYQQRQFEQLQLQVADYKREQSSVRKLFGLGVRRGMTKMGRALNLWSPVYNVLLWGELRGQGRMAM